MEVVKMEFETDPLAVQSNEYTEIKEQKPLLEKGTSSNSQLIWMKKEYEDPSSNLNSEVKIEEMSVTITFPLKCESEAESCDLDTVKEEETLEVTTEKDEFLPESTMNVGDSKTSLLKSTTPENFTSIENSTCDSSSEPESYDELLGSENNLQEESHRRSDKSSFKCDICGMCLNTASSLKVHIRSHSSETKEFKCVVCGKCFSRSGTLINHVRTHTGEKPYKCDICCKSFSQSGILRDHVRIHTGEKPYKCDICGKCFSQSGGLRVHLRTHTGEKPFTCVYCNRSFSDSGKLTIHIRSHTGEKPFKCEICEKCFSKNGSLVEHIRIHTGEKPFKCAICGKSYSQSGSLRAHTCKNTARIV
ncbi:zinc finger protein 239-like isoform X2 [Periplaneta americana]